ncbi:unnamed protein product [Lactuca saligna]|uniref:RING-type E3 ubiquitin transferase (cysteine targeting) n=1 Tax=Lactuca saligna TaxID=75948 RepID=A0AA35VF47_LACSI|nr:unnamed protein product [Lactuca saligna]
MVEQAAKPLARSVWVLDATPGKVRVGRDGDDHPAELIIFLRALANQVTSKMEVISGLMREGFLNEVAQWVVTNLRKTNPSDSSSSAYSWTFDLDGIAQMYQSYEETNLWCYKHEFLKDFFLSTGLLFQYEAELDAFLEFIIWRFSIWVHKPTLGYALMNLRYEDELTMETRAKLRTGLEGPGLTVYQKIWYCVATQWVEIIGYAHRNMDLLKDQDVIRIVLNLLKTNTSVATGLGTNWIVICAPDDGSCAWGYFDVFISYSNNTNLMLLLWGCGFVSCLLFGGSRKTLPDGVRLMGDISVLLLVDPSTAKSQVMLVLETRLKISYFCMAKSFGGNETQAKVNTQRVVGT